MKQAIGYLRCSTLGQSEQGVSLETQEAKIRAWATLNDFEVCAMFTDAGISGKRADNREGLKNALDMACKRKAPIVVYSLSRLARSTKDAIIISERLNKAGADLVSLSENLDTTSAAGRMIFRLLATIGEWERDVNSERTRCALQHMKSQGQRVGTVPYGYQDNGTGTLEPHSGEQDNISLILELRSEGLTLRGIKAALAGRGVANRNGNVQWRLETIGEVIKRAV